MILNNDIKVINTRKLFKKLLNTYDEKMRESIIQDYIKNVGIGINNNLLWHFGHIQGSTDLYSIKDTYEIFEKLNVWNVLEDWFANYQKIIAHVPVEIILLMTSVDAKFIRDHMNGICAHTINYNNIILYVYPEGDKWLESLEEICIHEYTHVVRNYNFKNNKNISNQSLLETLIEEGIAEYVVGEILGKQRIGLWSKAPIEVVNEYFPMYRDAFTITDDNEIIKYLHGDPGYKIPLWLGYSVGYEIVSNYIINNPDITIDSLLRLESEKIFLGTDYC